MPAIAIAGLLVLPALWVLWLIFRVYLQAKALSSIDQRANRLGRRLQELAWEAGKPKSEPIFSDHSDLSIYVDLVQRFNLQELWARVRTRINVGGKSNSESMKLVQKIVRLLGEIEGLLENDSSSRSIAQIGEWDEEKIAFIRAAGERKRASVAAIDQLVLDINRELS